MVPEHEAALATAPPHMEQHLDALRDELSLWLEQELPQRRAEGYGRTRRPVDG
jgi:hypothetical protein